MLVSSFVLEVGTFSLILKKIMMMMMMMLILIIILTTLHMKGKNRTN